MVGSLFSYEALEERAPSRMKVAFASHVEFGEVEEGRALFDGFKTMKAITWSYGLKMVVQQMRKFEHVELVFGCSNMLDRDIKLSGIAALVHQGQVIKDLQGKYGREISDRVEAGTCELFFESTVQSHQKLYLLANEDEGRYRVLTGSANFSERAWTGDRQKEVLICCEGREAYDAFERELYEPFKRTCATHVKDLKAILDGAGEKGFPTVEELPIVRPRDGLVIIEESKEPDLHISMADCALYGGLEQDGQKALESALKFSGGRAVLDTHGVETLRLEGARIGEAKAEEMAVCPKLIVNEEGDASLNGRRLERSGYTHDAKVVVEFIESLGIFSGDTDGYKEDAWKILCWYFATPFFPRLRRACRSAERDGRVSSLPMYMILFGSSNAGKTALMRFLGKAMCGEEVRQLPGNAFRAGKPVKDVKANTVRKPRLMQINQCGLPVLYDDVPSSELQDTALRKLLIDSMEEDYDEKYPSYPAVVATSNITPAMPREFRKRALFFESRASLPALDAIDNGHIPSKLTREVGSALFAEYAARMAPAVAEMVREENIDGLDVYEASSRILLDLFGEAGESPDWASPLSNNDYFGERAECRRATSLLVDYFRANPDHFERNRREGRLIVRYEASDRSAQKLLKEVSTSLPPRCEPRFVTGMLTLNLRETDDICDHMLKVRKGLLDWLAG